MKTGNAPSGERAGFWGTDNGTHIGNPLNANNPHTGGTTTDGMHCPCCHSAASVTHEPADSEYPNCPPAIRVACECIEIELELDPCVSDLVQHEERALDQWREDAAEAAVDNY